MKKVLFDSTVELPIPTGTLDRCTAPHEYLRCSLKANHPSREHIAGGVDASGKLTVIFVIWSEEEGEEVPLE